MCEKYDLENGEKSGEKSSKKSKPRNPEPIEMTGFFEKRLPFIRSDFKTAPL